MVIEPQAARYTSELTPEGYRVVIPVKRNWLVLLFICVWLSGWVSGELSASSQLTAGNPRTPAAFLTFWLLAWTVGGTFALATVLWHLAGGGYGPIAFDYGARTFRFAPSLDEAEARLLINELAPRLPNAVG